MRVFLRILNAVPHIHVLPLAQNDEIHVDALLQENGDYVLQEDSGRIRLDE